MLDRGWNSELGCGRRTEAEELFQQIVDAAGPTGLLPEEYDPIAALAWGGGRLWLSAPRRHLGLAALCEEESDHLGGRIGPIGSV